MYKTSKTHFVLFDVRLLSLISVISFTFIPIIYSLFLSVAADYFICFVILLCTIILTGILNMLRKGQDYLKGLRTQYQFK